jgi:hypothetical protein
MVGVGAMVYIRDCTIDAGLLAGQVSMAGDFQSWDYGRKENMQRYGTPQPPSYA